MTESDHNRRPTSGVSSPPNGQTWRRDLEDARRCGNLTVALRLRRQDAQAHGIDETLAMAEECDWWMHKRVAVTEGEIQRLKDESRVGWLERALEREQQLRRDAEHHLASLKAYSETQPYPDEVDRYRDALRRILDGADPFVVARDALGPLETNR